MLRDSATNHAVVFRDNNGHQVARGVTGRRYIFPDTWVVQYVPDFSTQATRQRWYTHWRTLPELPAWDWLNTILDKSQAKSDGMRMLLIPMSLPQSEWPDPPCTTAELRHSMDNMIYKDATLLRSYLRVLTNYGTVRWGNHSANGFRLNAGAKWVVFDKLAPLHLTSNLGF